MNLDKQLEAKVSSILSDSMNGINTLALAKIVEVDNANLEASIQLISMNEFCGEYIDDEVILCVPIMPIFNSSSFFVNAPYNNGDLVVVGFCQHSLEGTIDEKEPVEPLSKDKYSPDDAIILGNITAKYQSSSPGDFSITHKESGNYIKIDSGGTIKIKGNLSIEGELQVSKDIKATGKIDSIGGVSKGNTPYIHP